jgi:hypothetical protein
MIEEDIYRGIKKHDAEIKSALIELSQSLYETQMKVLNVVGLEQFKQSENEKDVI